MTQKHFRKAAGIGMGWLYRAWSRLHEPRIISSVYGLAYTMAAVFGTYSVFFPPRTIENITGDLLMSIIAGAIALGGAIGMATIAIGNYWVERTAAYTTGIGMLAYLGMVTYLQATGSGNRLMQMLGISMALLLLGIRFYWIGNRPYNPRLHPSADGTRA